MSMSNMDDLLRIARDFVEMADQNAENNPTSDSIQIVVVEPMKKPYKKTIENSLKGIQDIVGGYMENYFIGKTENGARTAIVCNEEGRRLELPLNRNIVGFAYFVGTIFITAYNYQGDNVSLSDDEANKFIRQFSSVEVYL